MESTSRKWLIESLNVVAVVAILAAFWGLCYGSLLDKSPTFDEMAHITGGYSYWVGNDYRLHPENGQLPQRLAALPLLPDHPRLAVTGSPAWQVSDVYSISRTLFFSHDNDAATLLRHARAAMAAVAAALGLLIYVLARRRYGLWGGLLAMGVFALSPSFLANGGLATSDVTTALTFLLAVVLFWKTTRELDPLVLLASGAAVGLLLVSKSSGLLIAPMMLAMAIIRLVSAEPINIRLWSCATAKQVVIRNRSQKTAAIAGVLLVHMLLAGVVVWSFYGFRYAAMNSYTGADQLIEPWEKVLPKVGAPRIAVEFASEHHVLPEAYLYGVSYTLSHAGNRLAFMNGQYSTNGWVSFFPYCFAVKNPVPMFAMLAMAAFGAFASWRAGGSNAGSFWFKARDSLYATAPLWVLIVVYSLFAVTSHINIGHRHILPIYPPLFVMAGAAACWLKKGQAGKMAIAAVMLTMAVQVAWAWPNYIPYFNVLAGGSSNGYRHMVDSSLDWGQDLPGLKRYLDSRTEKDAAYFSYFGSADPAYYEIPATQLPSFFDFRTPTPLRPLVAGTYCISASMLQLCLPDPIGPWNKSYEADYRNMLAAMTDLDATVGNETARRLLIAKQGDAWWSQVIVKFEQYRFARLCAYLRTNMDPVDQIGDSILVYRLNDGDLLKALFGPPPEMGEKVAAEN